MDRGNNIEQAHLLLTQARAMIDGASSLVSDTEDKSENDFLFNAYVNYVVGKCDDASASIYLAMGRMQTMKDT